MRLIPGYCLIFISFPLFLSSQTHWHRVKINLSGKSFTELQATGIAFDHGKYEPGLSYTGSFTDQELDKLMACGFDFEAAPHQESLSARANTNCPYKTTSAPSFDLPINYEYGSMGGFQTFQEMQDNLDMMKALYPNLITAKTAIRNYTTVNGNKIYYVKISDNPEKDEDEPEVLYTALHHAREPISASQLFYYMWHLLENYGRDSAVTALVNHRELFFVPCINPDGYVHNQKTDPKGGGYWRKNRSVNAVDTGVDLNRNYAFGWAFNNDGSSPDGKSDTYRGPRAFSEIETRAIREFCEDRNFQIALNYHAYGDLLLIPWGYLNRPTTDSAQYYSMANEMVRYNNFKVGTSANLLNYSVNGVSDDYMYGEQTDKNKIYVFTPEVGIDFWPHRRDILPLNISTQYMNWAAAWQAGAYASIYDEDNYAIDADHFEIKLRIKRSGLKNDKIIIQPFQNGTMVQHSKERVEFFLPMSGDTVITFPLQLTRSFRFGEYVDIKFVLQTGELKEFYSFQRKYTGAPIWNEDCTIFDQWIYFQGPDWGLTTEDFISSPTSMTDSPNGNAEPFVSKRVKAVNTIDLRNATEAFLSFEAKWDLDYDMDFTQIQVSENGTVFESLCGVYTTEGKLSQDFGKPIYTGTQKDWITEWIDLNKYLGKVLQLQLYMNCGQNQIPKDGFYIDDLRVFAKIPTSIENGLQIDGVSIQPNPAHDVININLAEGFIDKSIEISLLDVHAKKIISQKFQYSHQISLNVHDLSKGMYWIKIEAEDRPLIVQKIILE